MKLIIVSGLSGSGKSVALNTLEDLGYYCVDNLPAGLLEPFVDQFLSRPDTSGVKTAIGIDARNFSTDLGHFQQILERCKQRGIGVDILFLQADNEILLKRFSETRRKHPLTNDGRSLAEAIQQERDILEPISACAQLHVNTSSTNIHQLRDLIKERVAQTQDGHLSILLKSFGFKHGAPQDADFIFDIRCLPNPHWENELRPLTGRDPAVEQFLTGDEGVETMYRHLLDFFLVWIPQFERENRRYLTIALGCTGGQHRSVYMAERLGKALQERYPSVLIKHRELT